MKKIIFRLFAYLIDIALITIVVSLLGMCLPFCNRNKIVSYTEDSTSLYMDYAEFINGFDEDYLDDKKLDEDELKKIEDTFDIKDDATIASLNKYLDTELDDYKITEVEEVISNYVSDKISKNNYHIDKLSIWNNVIEFVLCVLYFGVLQFFLKGQTLGKKLMRLYVVNSKDENEEVQLPIYIVRSFMVTTTLLTIGECVFAIFLSFNNYSSVMNIYSNAPSVYTLVMLMFMLFRDDQKGFHDLLLGTRVKLLEKDGTEYTKTLFKEDIEEVTNKEVENKEESKEEVKEAEFTEKEETKKTSKKTTTTKKNSKKSTKKTNDKKVDNKNN